MRIARVFPRRTKMTPTDEDAYVGEPKEPLIVYSRHYDEIHISVTFTWDIPRAEQLAKKWAKFGKVLLDGPAMGNKGNGFTPGMYVRQGVIFTSRGCPNSCWYCFVPEREGEIRTLPVSEGNVIQDNNLLACPSEHINSVFAMLKAQKQIEFSGGFESLRVTSQIAEQLSHLKIKHIWLSYDGPCEGEEPLRYAVENLTPYFKRDKIRCYVLIGYPSDTLAEADKRLRRAWRIGTLPFAMRYRRESTNFKDSFVYTERGWNLLTRQWSRPAIIKSMMQK